jgi:hypothetical protein
MRIALLLLPPIMLLGAELHIDHVTVAGADIRKLQAGLRAIGIPSVYGGAHSNHTTEMALVSLPDGSYLELMALVPHADPRRVEEHVWAGFLKDDAGPCAWALRETDLPGEVQRLKAAGVEVSAPAASGRERPDGVRLNWETSDVGPERRGTFFPFLIHDLTPRDQRAFPLGKPGTEDFGSVTRVVIAVHDLDRAIERYRQAYALAAPARQEDRGFGARLAVFQGTPVVLAQPIDRASWLAARLERFGDAPCAFILGARQKLPLGKLQHLATAQWNGAAISWFDAGELGWHLGFEKAP